MYDEFYGLEGRPFQLTPDPDFFFESATQRKALSYLGFGLAQGEGFIVVTGEVGAGKSTLAAHLLATIDRQRLTAAQVVTSRLDGSELVHVAAQAFGLAVAGKDKPSALRTLEQFLHAEARAGRRALLVVDEAQHLSIEALEELRMLSNFQLGAHPLLQILLLGQPEFRSLLAQAPELEQLRQRVIASHHLEGMDSEEVGPYVEHRLARVGWHGNPAFDAAVFPALAEASGGIPRRVNRIVGRLLLLGAVEQRQRIGVAMLGEVLADTARDNPVTAAASSPDQPGIPAEPPPNEPAFFAPNADWVDRATVEAAFAARDELIAELQQAVIELSDHREVEALDRNQGGDALAVAFAGAVQRIATLEARTLEQERTLRHTLTMLIEWIESDDPHRAAA